MSGVSPSRFLLDTNAIIQLLKGNVQVLDLIANADYLAISVISEIEFTAFSGLSRSDLILFEAFKERVEVIDLVASNHELMKAIRSIREDRSLKLPDAIIAASAQVESAVLVTADTKMIEQIGEGKAQGFDLILSR